MKQITMRAWAWARANPKKAGAVALGAASALGITLPAWVLPLVLQLLNS